MDFMATTYDGQRFRLMYELGYAFASRTELDELIPFVIAQCRQVLDAEGVSVLVLDEDHNELYFPYISEEDPEVRSRLARLRFSAESGIAGSALRTGRAEKIDDAARDPRFYAEIDRLTGFTTRSLMAAPMASRGTPVGVIEVVNRRSGGVFTDDDLELLVELAKSIAVAIENADNFGRLKASEQILRAQVGSLKSEIARHDPFAEIIAASAAMADVFRQMESAAATSIPVLIEGETGTGKELVARAIHRISARAEGPLLAVNCAAVPETLLESELFGHRRGAFTGAVADQMGLFRAASGGTIFLDEIGEMPLTMQAKLLRVIEDGEVTAIGDARPHKVDVRVISATNRDLKAVVAAHTFRTDLYYRLAVFPIRLPPLRERREDIPLLAARFLEIAAERHRKRIGGFEPDAMALLCSFDWPGNVRELRNEVERAVAMAREGETITAGRVSRQVREAAPRAADSASSAAAHTVDSAPAPALAAREETKPPIGALHEARSTFEAGYISQALERFGGNVLRAARALEVSRATLLRKIKQYRLR